MIYVYDVVLAEEYDSLKEVKGFAEGQEVYVNGVKALKDKYSEYKLIISKLSAFTI